MSKRKSFKSHIATALVIALTATVFAPVCSAQEPEPDIPDISEYNAIIIDELHPETEVIDLINNTVLSSGEELKIYDFEGYSLSNNDYVGNNSTVIISDNDAITEVYKVKLYGDLNFDGKINSADLVDTRKILLGVKSPADSIAADIVADGAHNILDLTRLKKNLNGVSEIFQSRMSAYSARFNWLDTIAVPFSINSYEEIFEDFSVVSNDIDLTFSRYYNSNNTDNGMLGTGWTTSFEGSCTAYNNNSKTVKIYGQAPLVFSLINGKYICDYSRATLTATDNGFILISEDSLTYTFNQNGYLVSITDKNNNTVSITVDTNGKIQKVADSVGREYSYNYGENGKLSEITDCMQRTVNYTYDSSNRLASVTGVLGTVTEQYEYNANNKLIRISDAFDNAISEISYEDNSGIISSVTDSENVTTDYVYNEDSNSVTVMQDDTVIEENVYNRYNYLLSSSTDDGIQQNFYCNAYGDITLAENTDGSKTQYGYDSNGNPTKITTVTEEETTTEKNKYDSNNNLLSTATETEKTEYTYDTKGNVISVTKTDDKNTETTSYTYYDNGLLNTLVSDGVTTTYIYDDYWYPVRETSTDSDTVKHYNYNKIGWLISESATGSGTNTAEYDNYYHYNLNGDTLKETKDLKVISRTVYDNYGRIKQQISGAEYVLAYDGLEMSPSSDTYYNNWNEVPAGIRYYYGEDGKLSQIKASCYTINTDTNQKVTSVTAGNTVLAEYNYTDDAKELLSNVNYANGQSISYNYDTDGNITALYYGDTLAYSYTYDTEGTLTQKVNLIDSIQTDYTEDKITQSKISSDGSLQELYSLRRQEITLVDDDQNSYSNITSSSPGGGGAISGVEAGKLDNSNDNQSNKGERITERFNGRGFYADYFENSVIYNTFSYNETKNDEDTITETKIKKGNSSILNSSYEYNENNLPTDLTQFFNDINNSYTCSYDENGNITSINQILDHDYVLGPTALPPVYFDDIVTGSFESRYHYDDAGQLVRVDDEENETTTEYIYNGTSGNITAVKTYQYTTENVLPVTPNSIKTFSYEDSNWSDLLTSFNGSPLTYDALGNLLTYNGYTYTWEAGRRLTQITNSSNTYSYKYDDNGIRTQKTINGVTTHYTTIDDRITGQYDDTNTIYFRYDSNDSLIGFNLNGTEYIYLKNIQGDIEGILDQYGDLVVQYTYDAWGKVLSVTGSMADTVGTINPMRYRGYYLDSETGYYYLQSRYYNPEFFRFINSDEPSYIGLSGTILGYNLFAYCENEPINNIDPMGLLKITIQRWMIASIVDMILSFIPIIKTIFSPVTLISRSIGKAVFRENWKRSFLKGIESFKKIVNKVASKIWSLAYKNKTLRKLFCKNSANSLAENFFGWMFSSSVTKFLNKAIANSDIFMSVGGLISGLLDLAYDKKINNVLGVIYI